MILSDIQPQFFPRLHYFARMLMSDVFVLRDDVQFVRNHKYPDGRRDVSYQVHTPVRTTEGRKLLNMSVKKGGLLPIHSTEISYDQPWVEKFLNIIKTHYHRSPNYKKIFAEINLLLDKRYKTVAELNIATISWGMSRLLSGNATDSVMLSLAEVNKLLSKDKRIRIDSIVQGTDVLKSIPENHYTATQNIVELCKLYKANEYLGGETALRSYMQTELFQQNGIRLSVQDWTCPVYTQQTCSENEFIPNLSIIDFLMEVPLESGLSKMLGAG